MKIPILGWETLLVKNVLKIKRALAISPVVETRRENRAVAEDTTYLGC